jgi:hypothetical protein
MTVQMGSKLAQTKKARIWTHISLQERQNAVKAFNQAVKLMRISMNSDVDVSLARESFQYMRQAINDRDYEGVIEHSNRIFEILRPNFGAVKKVQRAKRVDARRAVEPRPMPEPLPPEPAPRPVPERKGIAVEKFTIEDVFVIYNDGRLIYHACQVPEEPMPDTCKDDQIMSSMFVAIQQFMQESMRRAGELGSFEYGENKIIMEKGNHIFIATVLAGKEPPMIREEMANIVTKFEGLYAGVIEDWDGDIATFKDADLIVEPLVSYHKRFTFKEAEEEVKLLSALEFFQGYIRLKVAVKNKSKTIITDSSLRLTFNKKALVLSHIEPDYTMDGTAVELGIIQPDEKKTVAFYLDPLICMESFIDGTLTYKDYKGKLLTAIMKRRPADIVCPIFYTEQNINTAMLKRLIDEMKYKDSKIFYTPTSIAYEEAFQVAKNAVQGHDVRFVREFKQENPVVYEAWFYAKTKVTDEEMVIRVTVREKTRSLEAFVASSNLATMTGLLAELGHNLNKEMKRFVKKEGVERVEDEEVRKEIEKAPLLIDKYLDSEMSASETEVEAVPEQKPKPPAPPPPPPEKPKEEKKPVDKKDDILDDLLKEIEDGEK